MKKLSIALLCLLLVGICACRQDELPGVTTERPTTTSASAIVELDPGEFAAYSEVIKDYQAQLVDNEYLLAQDYAFCNIEGTNLLLLGIENFYIGSLFDSVYAIQNGVAARQEEFRAPQLGHDLITTLFKNGTIRSDVDDAGARNYCYHRMKNGELKFQTVVVDEGNCWFGFIDDKRTPISKEEFDRVRKEFEGDGQTVELDWKPLAGYGGLS